MSQSKHPFLSGVAGGMAGICEISITMPLDTIKTQMQLTKGQLTPTVARIYANGGIASFYAGFGAMLTQVSAKAGIRFLSFE